VESDKIRHVGMYGRVLKSSHHGISAILTNGEKLTLFSDQFDYLSEGTEKTSHVENDSVNN